MPEPPPGDAGPLQGVPAESAPPTYADAMTRLAEADETLRAIGAGEVDAFVISDGRNGERVFTLATADRPYRLFVENMRDGAATLSSDGIILYANRRLADLLSCAPGAIVGSPLDRFVRGRPFAWREIGEAPGITVEVDLTGANGESVPVQVGSSPLLVDGADLTCLTFTDLTAQKAQAQEIARLGEAQAQRLADLQDAQAALTRLATHDALTGLPNRALLLDRISQALAHARRSGRCTGVLFVDLDRFKQINDTQGHAVGDAVLRSVAEALAGVLRPMDTVARIGGDEFVVLAPDLDGRHRCVEMGGRIVGELGRTSYPGERGEGISASVGVSVSLGGGGTAETMLAEADRAMYQAKSLGGRRSAVFDATLGRQVRQRSSARLMLEAALEDCRVTAHYQPIVDLATGSIAGFEALARISQTGGTILPPAAFIPVAEDTGLVIPLGTQVLRMACRDAHDWPLARARLGPSTVAVNLSSRQFETGDLASIVQATLDETGLEPSRLHFELTETALMDLHPGILEQLTRIRSLGVQIGLDDFGTGYASLTHLRRLPLSFVKIDQTFIHGLGTEQDERIVAAVIDLAANLGLRSIAEGVERTDQLVRLRELGCDQAQGYLFARPLSLDAVPAALEHPAW